MNNRTDKCEFCGKAIGVKFSIPKVCSKCLHRAYRIGIYVIKMNQEINKE